MAIPNPNPNIADGIKSDNKTYSSNKIESLIKTATELPIPEAGDAGKVLTVNSDSDGYELDVIPSDVPTIAAGDEGKVITVNSGEDGYELTTPLSASDVSTAIGTALGGILKKTSITATTSANGNVIQPFPIATGVVVSAVRTDDDAIVIPYIDASSTGTNYMFNVCAVTSGHAPIATTEVTIDIYYLDLTVTVTP